MRQADRLSRVPVPEWNTDILPEWFAYVPMKVRPFPSQSHQPRLTCAIVFQKIDYTDIASVMSLCVSYPSSLRQEAPPSPADRMLARDPTASEVRFGPRRAAKACVTRLLVGSRTTHGAGSSAHGAKVRPRSNREAISTLTPCRDAPALQRTSSLTSTDCCSSTPESRAAVPGAILTTQRCDNFLLIPTLIQSRCTPFMSCVCDRPTREGVLLAVASIASCGLSRPAGRKAAGRRSSGQARSARKET
jgi:hypothetical protein